IALALPLLGTLGIALGYRSLPGRSAGWIGTATVSLAFAAAIGALISLQSHAPAHRQLTSSLWTYAVTVGIDARASILVDPLSVFMLLVVTGVSALIHLYSVSYMESDRGFARYFSYLNFFVFSMLLLVLAGNFLLLIVGWAFVGAASYLLISFWYRRSTATRAGIKAFVINVVGDAGLVLGTYFLFRHTGTLEYLGAFHAANTGAFAQSDIKRVIAYSTMSQIGYMIMGVSIGAYAAGLFHLMTHAFFKALLFMGVGSLIGAMAGEQSLERMGGFRKALPFTCACFV